MEMELEELKQQMNRELESKSDWAATVELKEMIHRRSGSVVQKIRRSLWIELMILIFINVPLAFDTGIRYPKLLQLYLVWFIFLLFIATFPVLGYLISKTYWFEKQSSNIRENLSRIHFLIHRYCQINMLLAMLSAPIGYCLGLLLAVPPSEPFSWQSLKNFLFTSSEAENWISLLILLGILLFFELVIYFLMRWYLRVLFGKYLVKIKQLISELEAE
jgi:hypothetical protein